ncbi:chromosomal replication initiator protein DnaA [Sphingomonas oligophenolica]|uniref:Chromosomal replication initiator protein DnaA n=1 Tax=Sphingomonas oligophenolica TaxID=301154 RepID=A0A502CIV2_9SPHN|nr:chromosomal replication initiator protein DnaA [Sphingomonas oligophenolica]TPG12743.1 chromosomal replication initiator protein DnaA [Sphingomonas oligophenolica]
MEGLQGTSAPGEARKAWTRVRANLRESAGIRLFEQWLKPMELIDGDGNSDDGDTIRLGLPSAFMTNWVRSHYADRLMMEFKALLPRVRSVSIETRIAGPTPVVLTAESGTAAPASPTVASAVPPGPVAIRPVLDARFTFDRFVVDTSNRVAFNAARTLSEPGPPRFSPLFLHAGTGQGKTHLMHAIGHAFLEARPGATVICMSAERFMYDFVAAMRARDTFSFKQRLRNADLLLIDDLQFIAGKDATQEEFFHTVNEIMSAGKRLVISADRCPQALDGVEARIVSRMSAGLVADIKAPDLALRRAILTRKCADIDAAVPTAVLDLLAARIHANIRELEGALNRVVAYAQLTGDTIDLDFAVATLGDVLRGAQRRVTIDEIQKLVSAHFELKPLDLISARRSRVVARPRQIAMYLAKRLTTRSLPEIGRKFGGRDHSTVIHAVRKIEELRDTDRDIDTAVRVFLRELEA